MTSVNLACFAGAFLAEGFGAGVQHLAFQCDDIFETFDEDRTAAACKLMHSIAGIGQAIYFTHHAHVAEIAQRECREGVTIHEIAEQAI